MRIQEHSHRYGREIIASLPELQASLFAVVVNAQEKVRKKNLPSPQWETIVRDALCEEEWSQHEKEHRFARERVAVILAFSHYAFVYRELLHLLAAFGADKIDSGVLFTFADSAIIAKDHASFAPSFCSVKEDLAWLRPTLTVPLWIVALK